MTMLNVGLSQPLIYCMCLLINGAFIVQFLGRVQLHAEFLVAQVLNIQTYISYTYIYIYECNATRSFL